MRALPDATRQVEHAIGERDLDLPNHVDKAHKLLATNTAVVNITLNPI